MDSDDFEIIADAAMTQFDEQHIGLQAFLSAGKNMEKSFEQNWRFSDYKEIGDFFISQNKRNFHLIGFMDALAWGSEEGFLRIQELLTAGTTYSDLVRRLLKTSEFTHGEEDSKKQKKNTILKGTPRPFGMNLSLTKEISPYER